MSRVKWLRYKGAPIKVTYADGSTVVRKPSFYAPEGQRGETRRERYHDYLRSHVWQEKRQAALKRAKHRCAWCRSPDQLEVHHPSYHNLGKEGSRHLLVLCHDCHAKHHGKPP